MEDTLSLRDECGDATGARTPAVARAARRVVDYVGARLRHRRSELGWTQDRLATKVGISYQQVQKYETGANRISAGRLYQMATCLGVEVGYFYERLVLARTAATPEHGGKNRATIELVRNFTVIANEPTRAALSSLIKILAEPGSA